MEAFTRDLGFINFNGEKMPWVKFNGVDIYNRQKNLFDPDNVTYIIGYFTRAVTPIRTHANARTLYIPCEPNTTYRVTRNMSFSQFHFGYTEELPAVGVDVLEAKSADYTDHTKVPSLEVTTGANAKYLVVYCYNGYVTTDNWDDIIKSLEIEEM